MKWLIIIVIVIVIAFIIKARGKTTTEKKWKSEKIYLKEQVISIDHPIKLIGKPDKVILLPNGELQVVEVKSIINPKKTPKIYKNYIMQLSAYAYLLRKTQQKPVSAQGIVRFSGIIDHDVEVKLFDDEYIESAYKRYNALLDKKETPRKANSAACVRCKYKQICF